MSLLKSLKVAVAALALSAFLAPTIQISSAAAQAAKPAVTKKADTKNVKKAKAVKKKADPKAVKKASAKKPAAKKAPAKKPAA